MEVRHEALSYTSEIVIRRSPEDVFDYCSDIRDELEWNPNVKYAEKLTDGLVDVGTRYRAQWSNSGPTTVEVVQFDRPRMRASHAHARGMDIRVGEPSRSRRPERATRYTWNFTRRAWPGFLHRSPSAPCDGTSTRICAISRRHLSPARRGSTELIGSMAVVAPNGGAHVGVWGEVRGGIRAQGLPWWTCNGHLISVHAAMRHVRLSNPIVLTSARRIRLLCSSCARRLLLDERPELLN
jgi:hypothetical protein